MNSKWVLQRRYWRNVKIARTKKIAVFYEDFKYVAVFVLTFIATEILSNERWKIIEIFNRGRYEEKISFNFEIFIYLDIFFINNPKIWEKTPFINFRVRRGKKRRGKEKKITGERMVMKKFEKHLKLKKTRQMCAKGKKLTSEFHLPGGGGVAEVSLGFSKFFSQFLHITFGKRIKLKKYFAECEFLR